MRCECGTIIALILLLLDLEPRIRDSNFQQRVSSNSNVFPREWKQRYLDVFPMGTQETSLLQKYRVHTGFSFIPLEFLPNFHACSRYFGNTRRFLKRGNFAVNFRQGPVLISTSDIIESRQDYILRGVEFEHWTGWAMKNFTRKEYLRKCALWKRSFVDRENLKNFEKLCNIWENWTQSKIIWT